MKILRLEVPQWEQFDGLVHGFLGRVSGKDRPSNAAFRLSCDDGDDPQAVKQNWCELKLALSLPRISIITARQVHGNTILPVSSETGKLAGIGDGLMTDAPNLCVGVMSADCVPILLVEPTRKIAAAVHAGWRGTAAGIAPRAVASMEEAYGIDPAALHVAMGPSIGSCCYEVGPEVAAQIAANWREELKGAWKPEGVKGRLDLRALNEAQLLGAGIPRSQISKIGPCTACHIGDFYSYRKEGKSGHQLSFIGWRG
ncbi:peptidoglycan editing factor PgeF [Candidatus Methylomirabilis sp.]|uniref:peptidoglycan editing factor PgeF n=1 Tax=Candidatus Methylomirabilis sp. TaxID=2032687 RepID=UPI002A66506D|nr:peptidoglycan editing factor PgeF [Candidatus Methylomirabilis sp.]